MKLSQEIIERYNMQTLEEFQAELVDAENDPESVRCGYYQDFLHRTDSIPNELIEGSVTSEEVADELYYREIARVEIAKYLGKDVPEEASINKTIEQRVSENEKMSDSLLGPSAGKEQSAEHLRRAVQIIAQGFTDEQAMEVATVFPAYVVGKTYRADEMLTYGFNEVGDPQLYRVVMEHTSQADWIPGTINTGSLYTPIGLNGNGYPVWSRPTGSHDAYGIGDIVDYNGTLYKSLIDGNVYSPEEYPAGWESYTE